MMKRLLTLTLALLLSLALAACGAAGTETTALEEGTEPAAAETQETGETVQGIGIHHVTIDVQDYGVISLELDGDTAPITVQNFLDLAESGFYDGLTFHRIMDGFMIQGGDPQGNGFGGSDQSIKGEFEANGVPNDISHTRGTISMARSNAPDSASSQFFIVHQDSVFLDGNYAAFGHVTDGMDVVDAIEADVAPKAVDNNGTIAPEDQPVMTSVQVVD